MGGVSVTGKIEESPNGIHTLEQAKSLLEGVQNNIWASCAISGRNKETSDLELSFHFKSFDGTKPLTKDCYNVIRGIGEVTEGYNQKVVRELMKYEGKGFVQNADNILRVIAEDGKAIGRIRADAYPDTDESCWQESLLEVGWDGNPYFMVNNALIGFDDPVRTLMYESGTSGSEFWDPWIPDLCGGLSLRRRSLSG